MVLGPANTLRPSIFRTLLRISKPSRKLSGHTGLGITFFLIFFPKTYENCFHSSTSISHATSFPSFPAKAINQAPSNRTKEYCAIPKSCSMDKFIFVSPVSSQFHGHHPFIAIRIAKLESDLPEKLNGYEI